MAAARKLLWWKVAAGAFAILVIALVFSAYLKPDMLAAFGEVMAFCAALIK